MKIIIDEKENIKIINKSKFIGIVKRIYSEDEKENILTSIKNKYKDASHICYAYILNNSKRYFDDNEPAKTAGKPILEVLEKNNLNYVIAIVIRYFGGIKLGSNGLIRAYSSTISEVISNNIKDKEDGYLIKIIEDYKNSDKLEYLLKNSKIIKKDYQDKLIIEVLVKEDVLKKINNYTIIKKEIL